MQATSEPQQFLLQQECEMSVTQTNPLILKQVSQNVKS